MPSGPWARRRLLVDLPAVNTQTSQLSTPTTGLLAAEVSLRIVHDPAPHAVPSVHFPDGRVSTAWEDFHTVRRIQRPELYGIAQEPAA